MQDFPQDWHREDIKAAIRKTGVTCGGLSKAHGYCDGAVRQALWMPWPALQEIIAKQIGVMPQEIWPSRYDASGAPLSRLAFGQNHSPKIEIAHRQKRAAS